MRGKALLLAALMTGCSNGATAYELQARAAERAYASGRYAEAAELWARAAERGESPHSRAEARYRAAVSWQRGGHGERAAALFRELARSGGERAARARYALIEQRLADGDHAGGQAELARFPEQYPESGLAPQALRRHAAWLWDNAGPESAIAYARGVATRTRQRALAEHAGYELGKLYERAGQLAQARDQYLALAARFPYPEGALWDDALYRAAELELRLGNPRAAVAHLERMLERRESAFMVGSYERPRYDQARFRVAELYRDELGDRSAARRHFQRLSDEFPNSRLRDDALWNQAVLAWQAGELDAACSALTGLIEDHPDSRYVPCSGLLCPSLKGDPGTCRGYIREQLEPPR